MSVERVATATQTQFYLSQIERAGSALDKTQVLTASISANARNSAYSTATTLATTQTDMQDTQLSSLAALASQLRKAVSDSVANNEGTTLMAQAQNIFQQAASILNSKDANGDYIYSGGKTDVAPVTVSTLSQLAALPSVSGAFANGTDSKSVQVADGIKVNYGVAASDVGTGLMQMLSDIAQFDSGSTGNFAATPNLTGAQNAFLTGQIATAASVSDSINNVVAQNGYVYNRLTDATDQQSSMTTLYKGFISDIQDTNLASAATQLSLNQTQLQAALGVTAQLNKLSLLNYMSSSGA